MINNSKNSLAYKPDMNQQYIISGLYNKLLDRKKVDRNKIIIYNSSILVLLALLFFFLKVSDTTTIMVISGIVLVMVLICILYGIISYLYERKKHKEFIDGNCQIEIVRLQRTFFEEYNNKSPVVRYFLEVCDARGSVFSFSAPAYLYKAAQRHIGQDIYIVRNMNGKGIFDICDYCPVDLNEVHFGKYMSLKNINVHFAKATTAEYKIILSEYNRLCKDKSAIYDCIGVGGILSIVALIMYLSDMAKNHIGVFVGVLWIIIAVRVVIYFIVKKLQYNQMMNGEYEIAPVKLLSVYPKIISNRRKTTRYCVEICDRNGDVFEIVIPDDSYDSFVRHVDEMIYFVRTYNGKVRFVVSVI